MQRTLQIPSLRQHWGAIQGILGVESAIKYYLRAQKKPGFSIVFAKNPHVKNFRLPKISAPVNYGLANATKQ